MADIRIDAAIQPAVGVSAVEVGIPRGGAPSLVRRSLVGFGKSFAGSRFLDISEKNIDFKRGHNQILTSQHVTTQL